MSKPSAIALLVAASLLGLLGAGFLAASVNLAIDLSDPSAAAELQVSFVIALTLGVLLAVPAYWLGRRALRNLRGAP